MNPLFDMSGWRLVPSTEKSSLKEGTRVRGVNGWAIIEGILEGKSIKVDYYTGSHHWFEIYHDKPTQNRFWPVFENHVCSVHLLCHHHLQVPVFRSPRLRSSSSSAG